MSASDGDLARVRTRVTEESEDAQDLHRWLLTYSDMITLLLALFVVLFALSSLDYVKYAQFEKGIDASFNNGVAQPSSARTAATSTRGRNKAGHPASLRTLEQAIRHALVRAGLLNDVQLNIGATGLVIGLVTGKTFYDIDSAALSPVGVKVVDTAGSVLRGYANPIAVDGYTDDEPITGGPYSNNWQLSAERSVVVVLRLQTVARVDPTQLYAVGFGEYHPAVPNTSSANKAANRRVDIVVSPPGAKVTLP